MLSEFYAVTKTSVYHVNSRNEEENAPYLEKIAIRGESEIAVGEKLQYGYMVALTGIGIILYVPEGGGITSHQRRIEEVNNRWWGPNTSPVVALFLNKEDALRCNKQPGLIRCDPRWIDSTLEVVHAIGAEHPVFEVCAYDSLAFLPPEHRSLSAK